jgi:hypothetical protein
MPAAVLVVMRCGVGPKPIDTLLSRRRVKAFQFGFWLLQGQVGEGGRELNKMPNDSSSSGRVRVGVKLTEAFSHDPCRDSFAALADRPTALPITTTGGSSRTEPEYCRLNYSSVG